jgi:hypothetical protein
MPEPFDTPPYGTFVAVLTALISAPATTAPLVSVTRPLNCAFEVCARDAWLNMSRINDIAIAKSGFRLLGTRVTSDFIYCLPKCRMWDVGGNPAFNANNSYSPLKTGVYV